MKNEKQRPHHRLVYPVDYRPSLLMDDAYGYEINDVSEYGLKVKVDDDLAFMVAYTVRATITFPDGKEFDLSGQVVRVDQGFAGLQLDAPLPQSVITSEALFLMRNFPEARQLQA